MKAFQFRLEQALRWRRTQLDLEKAKAATAAAKIAAIRTEIESCRQARSTAAPHVNPQNSGDALALWGAFAANNAKRIRDLQRSAQEAERALAAMMPKLVEANRAVKLLENLKETAHEQWREGFNKELEAAAADAHMFRLHAGRER